MQQKLAARKAKEASNSGNQVTNQQKLDLLRTQAAKEGKLIQIHRDSDKIDHKLTLEEKIRARKKKLALDKENGKASDVNKDKKPSKVNLFTRFFNKNPYSNYTNKASLYGENNTSLFEDLEEAAVQYVQQNQIPNDWLEMLDQVFCINRLTELEKARVIFHYITAQNLNDLPITRKTREEEKISGYNISNPKEALAGIKYGMIQYSGLYAHLCNLVGLNCKIVHGKVKGANWIGPATELEKCQNTWNMVTIDGQKRLVDCHWGSRHLTGDQASSTIAQSLSNIIGPSQSNLINNTGLYYQYEEFYFMPNPKELISTHFPNESKKQLLDKPMSIENFKDGAKCWPLFYKLDCELISHKNWSIKAENGQVKVEIAVGEEYRMFAQIIHNLVLHSVYENRADTTDEDQNKFNQYVYHSRSIEGIDIFHIIFPKSGKYSLEFCSFCPVFARERGEFSSIVRYDVFVDAPFDSKNSTVGNETFWSENALWSSIDLIKTYGGNTVEAFRHNLEPYSSDCFESILMGQIGDSFKLKFKITEKDINESKTRIFRQQIYTTPNQYSHCNELAKHCLKIDRDVEEDGKIATVSWNVTIPSLSVLEKFGNDCGYFILVLYTDEPKLSQEEKTSLTVFAHFLVTIK